MSGLSQTAIEVCNTRWWDQLDGWQLVIAACVIIPVLALVKLATIWLAVNSDFRGFKTNKENSE